MYYCMYSLFCILCSVFCIYLLLYIHSLSSHSLILFPLTLLFSFLLYSCSLPLIFSLSFLLHSHSLSSFIIALFPLILLLSSLLYCSPSLFLFLFLLSFLFYSCSLFSCSPAFFPLILYFRSLSSYVWSCYLSSYNVLLYRSPLKRSLSFCFLHYHGIKFQAWLLVFLFPVAGRWICLVPKN